jgi:hypothetical protein
MRINEFTKAEKMVFKNKINLNIIENFIYEKKKFLFFN